MEFDDKRAKEKLDLPFDKMSAGHLEALSVKLS